MLLLTKLELMTPILSDLPGAPGRGGGLAVPGQRGRGDLSLRQHPRDLRVPAEVPRRPRGGGRRRAQLPHAGRHRTVQGESEGDGEGIYSDVKKKYPLFENSRPQCIQAK